jgi:acetate---CoA ligase (ADP-forming)
MSPETQKNVYPSHYGTEVLLKDGSRILMRPIKKEDTGEWLDFIQRLSPHSKYLRFHYVPKEMGMEDAIRFCTVDYVDSFAFVAEVLADESKQIIAIGRYYRVPDSRRAEIAIVIEDTYQQKGIGTKLVEWLANVARDNGITSFDADVLAENEEMMNVFRDYGFHVESDLEAGAYHVTFPIALTRKVIKKEESREMFSTLASLRSILSPRSIAVIGASKRPGSIGHRIFQSIMEAKFSGIAYPVNPEADSIMAVKAYPSILDIPGEVDLAMIVVRASLVTKTVNECGKKGVKGVIVISDGFKERGTEEGAARERELRDISLGYGMRVVGPNCMGIINTDPAISMNATFSPIYPRAGNVSFLSQSGAMGLVILEYANNLNMGLSSFASIGNRVDISPNDLLQYWEQDKSTKVILLYMESFGSPRKFSRLARRVAQRKPILAIKSGKTAAGSRAASSHTGALATPDIVSDALFRQAGIVRVDTVEQLFDAAMLLSNQPIPKGKRVVVVTNGGGPGIIAADACMSSGLDVVELSKETLTALTPIMHREISIGNPLDLTAGAPPEEFEKILNLLAADKGNDAVLTIFIPPTVEEPHAMENTIKRVAPVFWKHGKPLLACFIGQRGLEGGLGAGGKFVPCYLFPEDAATALAKAVQYGELIRTPRGSIPRLTGIKKEQARKIIETEMSRSAKRPLWLSADDICELLGCYGIRVAETLIAKTAGEASELAKKIGFPVVVKLCSSTITHKTEVGGVVIDVKSEEEVVKAYDQIRDKLKTIGREKEMEGVTVQCMVKDGVEVIVGVTQDKSFGPLIMFGLGGIYAELLKDVAIKLHPLTDLDARELIASVKMSKLFDGFRGSPPADKLALEDLLLRISELVEDVPEIAELDLNPVKAMPQGEGYWVVDARVLLR